MSNWLIIAAILLLITGLGSLLLLQFVPWPRRLSLNLLFATVTLGTVSTGWLALLLAEFNRFSLAAFIAVWFISSLILLVFAWRRHRRSHLVRGKQLTTDAHLQPLSKNRYLPWLEAAFLLGWMVVAGWLYFRPHEWIIGGTDAGVYVSLGAEIAQHGGFRIVDETLATLDPDLYPVVLRPLPANPIASSYLLPGFYVTAANEGRITPQFYPLHPTWQAVAFSLAGTLVDGVAAELRLTGLWMLLAALAIYMTARELAGRFTAGLALLALSLMALQVWFARYPTTEALTQFLLWAGLWGVLMWQGERQPSKLWAFLSGATLGSLFLVRIDVLIMLPLILFLIVALWARGWRKSDGWFVIPFVLLVAHSLAHAIWLSAPYFYEHIGYGLLLLWQNWWIPVSGIFLGAIFLLIVTFLRGRFVVLRRLRRPLLAILIGGILLFALYGWFIRPIVAGPTWQPDAFSGGSIMLSNHENWLRLGWYLSPLGIGLAVIGSCLLLWRVQWKTALLLAVGFLFAAVYLWNVRANPHQVYVMRRYVPVVAPFFIFSAAYLLGDLLQRARRLRKEASSWAIPSLTAVFVLGAIWLVGLGWSARGFVSQIDHQGLLSQLAELNQRLPPQSVLLFNDQSPVGRGDFWGTPLKYIFGHDVFTLRDLDSLDNQRLAESIKSWQNNGRAVIWIGDPSWLDDNNFQFQQELRQIQSRRLESSYEHKPQAVVTVEWALPLAFVE